MNTNSLSNKTINGFAWMFTGKGFQAFFQFFITIVLARILTPSDFGVVSAATVIITFTTVFSMIGVGPALIQRPNLTESHIRTGFTITLILSIIFSAGLFVSSTVVSAFFNIPELKKVLKVMSILFILKGLSVVSESLIQRNLQFKKTALIEIISYFAYAIIGVVLALYGFNYWSLVIANITQSLLRTVLLNKSYKHSMVPMFDLGSAKELMFFGGGYTIARISNQFALQADNLVVGKWLGAEYLGLYSRAYQLMIMPANLFGQVMDKVLFPVMSKIQKEEERLTLYFKMGITLVSLITIPIGIFISMLSYEIVIILFGDKWLDLVPVLQILSLGLVFRTGYKISDSLVRATGAVYRRAIRQVVYAICVFVGSYIGQYYMGIKGVAIGVFIAIFINYILMTNLSMSFTKLNIKDIIKAHMPGFILGVIAYASIKINQNIFESVNIFPIIKIITSILMFSIIIILLIKSRFNRILGEEFVWIKGRLMSLIKSNK